MKDEAFMKAIINGSPNPKEGTINKDGTALVRMGDQFFELKDPSGLEMFLIDGERPTAWGSSGAPDIPPTNPKP